MLLRVEIAGSGSFQVEDKESHECQSRNVDTYFKGRHQNQRQILWDGVKPRIRIKWLDAELNPEDASLRRLVKWVLRFERARNMVKSELDNWASEESNKTSEGDQDIDGNSEDSRDVTESTEITQDSEELHPSGRGPRSHSVKSHSHRVDYESTASSEAEEERMILVLDKKIHWGLIRATSHLFHDIPAYTPLLCVICIGPRVTHTLSQYGKKASKVIESNLLWADSFREHVHLTSFQPSRVVLSLVLDISATYPTYLETYENNNGLENMAKPKSKQINAKDSNG
ncbi:hypothetical protein K438DRAFT_1786032 [Mycena galopus ATCC 62051]|nr:hypothetical protein K438DRAFT_1786032 [Mycena galopus ATCC 62051]